MAHNMAPQPTEGQIENKARDMLNGMSRYRIDPTRIKSTDNAPEAKGGQGVVVAGTLLPLEAFKGLRAEALGELLFDAANESQVEKLKELFFDVSNKFRLQAIRDFIRPGDKRAEEGVKAWLDDHFPCPSLKGLSDEALTKVALEGINKMLSNVMKELIDERKVAIKKLEWPQDDAEASTKFFKVQLFSKS